MALSVAPKVNPTLTTNGGTLNVGTSNPGYNLGTTPTYYQTGGVNGSTAATFSTSPVSGNAALDTGTGTLDTSGNGTLANGTGTVDTQAAAAAAAAAKAAQIRDSITGLAHNIMNVYDSLYGSVDTAGADQAKQVNNKYDTEGTGLINQFNQDFPTIGNSYSARGAYDSSYRQDAENNASQSLADQQSQLGIGRNADLAKVGQFVATNKATLDSNKGGINAILDQITNTTDPNELTSIQNAIQQKLLDAQTQQSQLGTQGGYVNQIQSLVPTADQTASITANLHSILQGEANPMLKKSVGAKLIQTSGLPDDQKNQLLAQFNTQVDQAANPQA